AQGIRPGSMASQGSVSAESAIQLLVARPTNAPTNLMRQAFWPAMPKNLALFPGLLPWAGMSDAFGVSSSPCRLPVASRSIREPLAEEVLRVVKRPND